MKIIKEKQNEYNKLPIDAIITLHTIIPGINGRMINVDKSYQKMKGINEFKESLLVFDEIEPNKSINNIYDKIIISGNQTLNNVVLLTSLDNRYCYTENLTIKKECMKEKKHTILIHKITNNYLINIKDTIQNGKIFFLENVNQDELNLIIKYLINNNYDIKTIDEIIGIDFYN